MAVGGAGVSVSTYQSHAGCHGTVIKRVPSPDGPPAVHRYFCGRTSVGYTAAVLRTRPTSLLPQGDEVGHPVAPG
jgi:hypothetical protein